MQRQMAKVVNHGTYYIVYDDASRVNPYIVKVARGGHTKKLGAYANYGSAMEYVVEHMKATGMYYAENAF